MFKRGVLLFPVGVILPASKKKKRLFWKYKCEKKIVPEYGIAFFAVEELQNYTRIFKRHKIENVVVLTDTGYKPYNFKLIDGKDVFERMSADYVRKYLKACGDSASVTFVDKDFCEITERLVDLLCPICGKINLCTMCTDKAEAFSNKIMECCGAVVNVVECEKIIDSDVAVVVNDFKVKYHEKCLVIGKTSHFSGNRKVEDFHIPFGIKVPFNMPRIVFKQCVELAGKKSH